MQSTDPLSRFRDRLSLPLIAAPMFLVSGVELVVAACRNGVIGAFPTVNCRSPEQLDGWLGEIEGRLRRHADESGKQTAPVCPNLIVHRSNARLAQDLAVLLQHRPEIVITSVGSPAPVLAPLHDAGALVFADVASIRHAERAVASGADGLVLLTAGAGGQTGWLNPFVFVRAVRAFFDGPLVLAGGVSDGHALRAAQALGCDLGYMGTRFIATRESMAPAGFKDMIVSTNAADIVYTAAISGVHGNFLKPSIDAAGANIDLTASTKQLELSHEKRAWKNVWSAGQGVGSIDDVPSTAELCERLVGEYREAMDEAAAEFGERVAA